MLSYIFIAKIGLLLASSFLFAEVSRRLKLPSVIGYIIGGMLLGPFALDILDKEFLKSVAYLKEFSLAYILFLVGKNVRLQAFKGVAIKYTTLAISQALLAFLFVTLMLFLLIKNLFVAAIAGIIAAPTAAISVTVLDEYRSEGPITQSIYLLITIDNLLALIFFAILYPIASGHSTTWVLSMITMIFSLSLGFAMGLLISYAETVIEDMSLLLIVSWGIFLIGLAGSSYLKLNPYVYALIFGIVAANSSVFRQKALEHLTEVSGLIYALFFFIAGASVDFKLLVTLRFAVWLYIIGRVAGKFIGTWVPTKIWRLEVSGNLLAISILAQGGLSTGLALALSGLGPQYVGVMSVVLASTVIFEVVGLILLRQALVWGGEVTIMSLLKRQVQPMLDEDFQRILQEFTKKMGIKWGKLPEITLKVLVRKRFPTVRIDSDLETMAEKFRTSGHNIITVLDNQNMFVGVVIFRDFERRFTDTKRGMERVTAWDILTKEYLTNNMNLMSALEKMRMLDVDALPLVEDNRVIGVVNRKDLLAALL